MEPESPEERQLRYEAAVERLAPLGFTPTSMWRFTKAGVTYDLSAANLDMIERIEREGLCVAADPEPARWLAESSTLYMVGDKGCNRVAAGFHCYDRSLTNADLAAIATKAAEAMNAYDDMLTLVNSSILCDLFGLIEDSGTPEAAKLFPFVQAWVAMRDGTLEEPTNA